MILEKIKNSTISSSIKTKRWSSYAILVITAILFWPFMLVVYLCYITYKKKSWTQDAKGKIGIIILILIFLPLGFSWAGSIFSPDVDPEPEQDSYALIGDTKESSTQRTSTSTLVSTTTPATSSLSEEAGEEGPSKESERTEAEDLTSVTEEKQEEQKEPAEVDSDNVVMVSRVVDGDTVAVTFSDGTEETLRLIGIDTPETKHPSKPVECFGHEASQKAEELLSGQEITLEFDDSQGTRDQYGRLLTYVILPNGSNFNQRMIEEGYAYEYTYDLPYRYQGEFKASESSARADERGLWSSNTCDGEREMAEEEEDTTETNDSDTEEDETDESDEETSSSNDGYWYASGHYSAQYYYHESCDGWQELSERHLQMYTSEAETQADNPTYELHHGCEI